MTTPLTIDDLFTPLTQAEVLSGILATADLVGFNTTAWQSGQISRTILTVVSQKIADAMAIVATMNKGGFLDYASLVTPEGGPGWLDILALSRYRVTRIPATYATTPVTFTTTAAASGGTFASGAMHVASGSKTYHNVDQIIIPAGVGSVTGDFAADISGSNSSAGVGSINTLVVSLVGVSCSNATAAVGTNAETNAAMVTRCRSKLASLSVTGPSGAYDYAARTINGDNQVAVASGPLTSPANPVTRSQVVTDPSNGTVTTFVASAVGPYETPPNHTGTTAKNIVSSTDASPIVLTMGGGHGFVTGDEIYVVDHLINIAANGSWAVTVAGNDITLTSSAGSGAGAGGATGTAFQQSDLDLIDKSIQANAVPEGTTALTATAAGVDVEIVGAITVTGATANLTDVQIQTLISDAISAFAAIVPLGGYGNLLYLQQIKNSALDAIPTADRVNLTLSLPAADVVVAAGGVVNITPAPIFTVTRL